MIGGYYDRNPLLKGTLTRTTFQYLRHNPACGRSFLSAIPRLVTVCLTIRSLFIGARAAAIKRCVRCLRASADEQKQKPVVPIGGAVKPTTDSRTTYGNVHFVGEDGCKVKSLMCKQCECSPLRCLVIGGGSSILLKFSTIMTHVRVVYGVVAQVRLDGSS
ncbi:hypothetical protein TcasGA2_TC007360 [Tribolium castaneum]|uniref:Uncharacterized protein n=1 Tax=Tribolium castaneum TaxID=7070 RepID=D2A020_TRICA|nr:hypothetical protein TcasGA2_TC007360 [Tribolium castaneum]